MKKSHISFKKKLGLSLFKKYIKAETALHELKYLFWECTLRCNLNCIHCGSDCTHTTEIEDLPLQDFLKVTKLIKLQYNPNNIMITITGGEPLVRKDIELCGAELTNQGYTWGIVTNGLLLTKKRIESLLNAGLKSITISLDGLENSHNWLRNNPACFSKTLEAIQQIANLKNIVFDVVTCLNQKNIKELYELKELLISIGVKKWRIFTISPIGRAKNNQLLDITNIQFLEVMEFIKQTREEAQIVVNYECEGFVAEYESEVRDSFFFCRAGINVASVLVDGSISACPNIDLRYAQGNIYKDDFLKIWNNKFDIMRQRNWMKTGICMNCEVFKWCLGNGMHLRDFETNNVLRCQYNMLNEE